MSWIQSRVYFNIICLVQIWGDKDGWNEVEYSFRVYFDILCLVQIWGDNEGWNEVDWIQF